MSRYCPYNRLVLHAAVCMLACSAFLFAGENAALERAVQSITVEDLNEITSVLADDTMEGREAGTRGGYAAGGYLLQRLARLKLTPAGDDGTYYQSFGAGYRNLLAILPGSDPELSRQVIVIGAHYDHVGYGTRRNSYGPIGYIHNGADDNASGTAAVLEIAEALTRLPEPPARSILFAFWDGEEKGLLGSKHWMNHPTLERDRIVFAVNFDMVGRLRNNTLEVYGAHTGTDVRRILMEATEDTSLSLSLKWKMKADSDHHVFFSHQVPVVMFHTGLHEDYHRPSDDVETLNHEGIERVSRYALRAILAIANREEPPRFREESQWENETTPRQWLASVPARRLRLGVWWRVDASSEHPLIVSRVVPDSAAARAGIRVGDRLIRMGGTDIRGEAAFRRLVDESPSETMLVVQRGDAESPTELPLKLAGPPRLLGIILRGEPANPGIRLIGFVDPASPAARAGLAVGDRLYSINGRRFTNEDDERVLLPSTQGTWHCQVERNGRLQNIVAVRANTGFQEAE